MPTAVGLYVYRFEIYPIRGVGRISFDDAQLRLPPAECFQSFLRQHRKAIVDEEGQRAWHFEKPLLNEDGETDLYIRYGTCGFESDLINSQTNDLKYKREVDDYENISLFCQFWFPKGKNFGLMLFQSIGGRSCSGRVKHAFREFFVKQNPGFLLSFKKLLPEDVSGSKLFGAPIVGLSFLKRRVSGDRFEIYGGTEAPEEIEIAVQISAKKKGSFGKLSDLDKVSLEKEASALFLMDDEKFDTATASVKVGSRRRQVSIFGQRTEAGSIDVTDEVKFGVDGHPETESLQEISNDILADFARALEG